MTKPKYRRKMTVSRKKHSILKTPFKYRRGGLHGGSLESVHELQRINTIGDQYVYQLKLDDCITYFYANFDTQYAIYGQKSTNRYYIIKLDATIPNLKKSILNELDALLTDQDANSDRIRELYNINKIKKIGINCFTPIDLQDAKERVEALNKMLHRKCSNLTLNIDYIFNTHAPNNKVATQFLTTPTLIILCLYNNEGCISSIICTAENESVISIDSTTVPAHENKKYNTFLRGVMIYIIELLYPSATQVQSLAVNTISAYLLMACFNGIIRDDLPVNQPFFNYLKTRNITLNETTNYKELFIEYDKEIGGNFEVVVTVDITRDNITKARIKIMDTISKIIC